LLAVFTETEKEMQTFLIWLRGLISATISAAAGGVALIVVDPTTFNFHQGIGKLAEVCGALALVHAAGYLQASPLPGVKSDPSPKP